MLKLLAELIVPVVNPERATVREDVEPIHEWQPQESGTGIQLHSQTAGRYGIYVHHSGESPVGHSSSLPGFGQQVPALSRDWTADTDDAGSCQLLQPMMGC